MLGALILILEAWFLWNLPLGEEWSPGNRLIYLGRFGLGHRLSKLSAAYHLAQQIHVDVLDVRWGTCNDQDIFAYLFGSSEWKLQSTSRSSASEQSILVRNDVQGYYAGQAYKNYQVPLTDSVLRLWSEKLESDAVFFRTLSERFRFQGEVSDFRRRHEWNDHTVIGLHVRAGNGEKDHFEEASRGIHNSTNWLQDLAHVLRTKVANASRPLVFIATDTVQVISELQKQLEGIPVVNFSQERVPPNQGVSYQTWQEGIQCLHGWRDSAIDMMLLSQVDTLIAATRSTFTQILPLRMVLERGSFCEVDGRRLDCFDQLEDWLYRKGRVSGVTHKVMVHLPDPTESLDTIQKYLRSGSREQLVYGGWYAKKYRRPKVPFRTEWTWATSSH